MIPQVENLVRFLSGLPEAQQIRLAESLLEEAKWEVEYSPPKNKEFVEQLIREVEEEIKAGTTMPLVEFLQRAEEYERENPAR